MGLADELRQLEEQRASGELTDDEFEDAKGQLLAGYQAAAERVPPGAAPAAPPPDAAPAPKSAGVRALIVIAILVGLILVVPLVAIVAITVFGSEASTRFDEVGSQVSGALAPVRAFVGP